MIDTLFEIDTETPSVYRYTLTRAWTSATRMRFIMLNPSTADQTVDDPTIRRCVGFAKREGFGGIEVVNLFALRATDPAVLRAHPDPVGPDNDHAICRVLQETDFVVAAWGAHPYAMPRAREVLRIVREVRVIPMCFGVTKGRSPRHPLYVKGDQPLTEYIP